MLKRCFATGTDMDMDMDMDMDAILHGDKREIVSRFRCDSGNSK
jgi:hypothetical protein